MSFVGAFQLGLSVTSGGEIVHWSEVVFIDSLNWTVIGAVRRTSIWFPAGSVFAMYGLYFAVTKVNGLGTGPGTRAFPSRSRPSTRIWYTLFSAKFTVCVRFRIVPSGLHCGVSVTTVPRRNVHVTEAASMGSEKTTWRTLSIGTLNVRSLGSVLTIDRKSVV